MPCCINKGAISATTIAAVQCVVHSKVLHPQQVQKVTKWCRNRVLRPALDAPWCMEWNRDLKMKKEMTDENTDRYTTGTSFFWSAPAGNRTRISRELLYFFRVKRIFDSITKHKPIFAIFHFFTPSRPLDTYTAAHQARTFAAGVYKSNHAALLARFNIHANEFPNEFPINLTRWISLCTYTTIQA